MQMSFQRKKAQIGDKSRPQPNYTKINSFRRDVSSGVGSVALAHPSGLALHTPPTASGLHGGRGEDGPKQPPHLCSESFLFFSWQVVGLGEL